MGTYTPVEHASWESLVLVARARAEGATMWSGPGSHFPCCRALLHPLAHSGE